MTIIPYVGGAFAIAALFIMYLLSRENDALRRDLAALSSDLCTARRARADAERAKGHADLDVESLKAGNRRLTDEKAKLAERTKKAEGDLQLLALRYEEAEHACQVADRKAVRLAEEKAGLAAANEALKRERDRLRGRAHALEEAIVKHRNASGHDRCFLNDHDLYRAYDPQLPKIDPAGGEPLPTLLAGCAAYWLGQFGMPDKVPDKMEVAKKDVMS